MGLRLYNFFVIFLVFATCTFNLLLHTVFWHISTFAFLHCTTRNLALCVGSGPPAFTAIYNITTIRVKRMAMFPTFHLSSNFSKFKCSSSYVLLLLKSECKNKQSIYIKIFYQFYWKKFYNLSAKVPLKVKCNLSDLKDESYSYILINNKIRNFGKVNLIL